MSGEDLQTRIQQALDGLRSRLQADYGWTRCELSVEIHGTTIRLHGEVASLRLRPRIAAAIEPILPAGASLTLELRPPAHREWRRLLQPTPLWRWHPSLGRRELASELATDDGPVAVIDEHRGATLIRARDGTVAWLEDACLGPSCEPRRLGPPSRLSDPVQAVLVEARSYLGVSYRLGGASAANIDCSALVQRVFQDRLGLLLPRNSNDQLRVAGGGEPRPLDAPASYPGELLFIHSRSMGLTHVGIVDTDTVIHASKTRGRVVEVPIGDFLADAAWLRVVSLGSLLIWGRGQIGRECVELPERELV